MNDYAARRYGIWLGASLLLLIPIAVTAVAQAFQAKPNTPPQFDVATIKPSDPAFRPGRLGIYPVVTPPGRLIVQNATLKDLIAGAYNVQAAYQITGGPAWINSTRFDVEGKANGSATREQRLLMLRSLLTERFKLAFHREPKELAVYAFEVGKKAPNVRPLKDGEWNGSPSPLNHARYSDISALAAAVMRMGSDRPVVDRTGLKGNLAIDVDMSKVQELAAQENPNGPPSNTAMYDAMVAVIQDTLGLKLVSTKATIEVLVIDHAEAVTPN
jgi:uncharacterized protein (TIGR03435 family)